MLVTNLIKKSILLAVVFISCAFNSFVQLVVSTIEVHGKSAGGSTCFKIGQLVFVFKKGNAPNLNEDFQQVYTQKTTLFEELIYLKEILLYPNLTQ